MTGSAMQLENDSVLAISHLASSVWPPLMSTELPANNYIATLFT